MDDKKRQFLFQQLKSLLQEYGDVLEIDSSPGKYSLSSTKEIEVDGETHQGYYFAGLRELKNIVGFYFMPLHVCPELRDEVPASLQGILKGNTCFNIKALTPEIERDLVKMINLGIETYKGYGFI
ncbi:MAG: hypothetical protein WCG75_11515 [Armatimonadota bacterium]